MKHDTCNILWTKPYELSQKKYFNYNFKECEKILTQVSSFTHKFFDTRHGDTEQDTGTYTHAIIWENTNDWIQ